MELYQGVDSIILIKVQFCYVNSGGTLSFVFHMNNLSSFQELAGIILQFDVLKDEQKITIYH